MMAYEAQKKYDKTHTVMVCVKLNKNTDADILAVLENCSNRQGFIKECIRNNIIDKALKNCYIESEG